MVGPYIKSRGTVGTKMSANADLITRETYVHVQQRENITTSFSCMGQNMNKNVICLLFSGTWGTFNDHTGPMQLTHNVFTTLLESFAELIWEKRCSNLVATFAKIYFESLCR